MVEKFKVGDRVRFTENGFKDLLLGKHVAPGDERNVYVVTGYFGSPLIHFNDVKRWGVYEDNIELVKKRIILIRRKNV